MKPIVILGAGGFARETLDVVDAINATQSTWDPLGFIVDAKYGRAGELVNDKPILGDFTWLDKNPRVSVVCAVGSPEIRFSMVKRLHCGEQRFASLVHPSVIRTRWMTIGNGVVIAAGCVLSNTIKIGDHVHLNPSCTIGHDVSIGAFASLAPGVLVSGNVDLGEGAYVGTGAQIIERKSVGEWSIIGAGSTVISDVPANSTVVGVPARLIKQRRKGWHLQ